jgi:hypothetical protein
MISIAFGLDEQTARADYEAGFAMTVEQIKEYAFGQG